MGRERTSLSRRQLLGSVGAVGALSGVSGLGTWALFEDRETFAASMTAGEVGVSIDCDSCTSRRDGRVSFDFGMLTPGTGDTERFTVTADANPVRIWLWTNCPEPVDPLGDVVEVRLRYDDDCDGSTRGAVYPRDGSWVTLNEFREGLRDGVRLDDLDGDPCLDGEVCLQLEYQLPTTATWAEDLSSELTFELGAEQCRHVPEESVASPSPPSCPEPDCPDCVELGKLEVEEDLLEPDIYGFDELEPEFDDGTTYALEVLTATNKEDDDDSEETVCASFRLLAGDPLDEANAPAICSVAVKGGQFTAVYDVEPPSTRTRGEVCTVDGDGDSSPGALPAISNIVVWVCDDGEDDDDCAICRNREGERIDQATFRYAGPDGVDVLFDQQSSGNGTGNGKGNSGNGGPPEKDVLVTDIDDGDSFTVPLNGSGSPDFEVTAGGTVLTVPAQERDTSALHTSCSQVFEVGMQLVDDDGTYTLTVESAENKAGEQLCEVSD